MSRVIAILFSRPVFRLALAAARVPVAGQDPFGGRLISGEAWQRSGLAFTGRVVLHLLGDTRRLLLVDRALELEEAGQGGQTHRVLGDIAVKRVYSCPHVLESGDQDFHLLVGESRHHSSFVGSHAYRASPTIVSAKGWWSAALYTGRNFQK